MSRLHSLILRLPLSESIRQQFADRELVGLTVLLSLILIGHGLQ